MAPTTYIVSIGLPQWRERRITRSNIGTPLLSVTICLQGSPAERVLAFNKAIIDATAPYCVAYKPNLAFFECLGLVILSTGMFTFRLSMAILA